MHHTTHDLPRLLGRLTTVLRVHADSDHDLLRRFTALHDEDAFAELVRRHGSLVLGVCRGVLRDSHAAEDAFQSTFLLLAGRAARLTGEGSLAGWLYAAAWRTARQIRRANERRQRREQQASRPPAIADDLAWREVHELLDVELMRLPERYRSPLVLCYLEGLTQSEAARQLGWDRGVLRGRLERGRALLRRRLEKHGLPEAIVLLPKMEHVPSALQAATVRLALAGAATASGLARWHLAAGLLLLLVLGLGASAASRLRGPLPSPPPGMTRLAAAPAPSRPQVDRLGDPLPTDALFRLGTLRYRYLDHTGRRQLLRDGRTIVFTPRSRGDIFWVDTNTGRTTSTWALPQELLAAGFSADGRLAVLHDGKRSLQLWDLTTRKKIRTFEDGGVLSSDVSAAFSPDGRTVLTTIAVNGIPGLLRAWDVATGRQRWHEGRLAWPAGWRIAGFLPDSRAVVLLDNYTARVSVRDLATGNETRAFATLPGNSFFTSRLTPDGKILLLATGKPSVRSWDLATGKERPPLIGHVEPVRRIALFGNGKTLATGGDDSFLLVWDWPEGKLRRRIELQSNRSVSHLEVCADGKRIEVGLWPDRAARFFDLATGKEEPVYPEAHTAQVQGLAITSDRKVVSGGNDNTLRLWDLATGRQVRSAPTGLRLGVMSMSLSSDAKLVATGDINEGQVRVFTLPSCRLLRAIDTGGKSIRGVHFCGKTRLLLINGDEAKPGTGSAPFLALWDVERGREVRRLKLIPTDWQDRALSSDGRLLAGGIHERLSVWDFPGDREWRALPVKTPNPLTFAPDGRTLACSEWERFGVWELGSAQPRWRIQRPLKSDYVSALRFSPDGRWLAVGRGPRIELRDALNGNLIHIFDGHAGNIASLAFSPDSKRLVSSSYDTTMLVWDLAGVLARQRRPEAPDDAALAAAWTDLGNNDPSRVRPAMALLIDAPGRSVPLLRKRLRPATALDVKKIARYVADLDSDDVTTRERASRELEKAAEQAEEALRRLLASKPSPEARRRAERLLRQLAAPIAKEDRLREMRALEVLEHIGNAQALGVLNTLASGAGAAWLTREAGISLERLRRSKITTSH
jgi:RNA polymerase sigma factor (sigma-70 family)